MQSHVDVHKFSFFPQNCHRLELPSQFGQIKTIYLTPLRLPYTISLTSPIAITEP